MNTTLYMILMTVAAAFCISYGWGMRGSLMGGEKGAMLPGAGVGMLFAAAVSRLTGSELILQNWYFFAAAGAMGMSLGGIEPYGDTIGMATEPNSPHYNRKIGYLGLCVKGALWFALCGAYIALAMNAVTGKVYTAADIIILFASAPFVQALGCRINRPFKPAENRFPKIYFAYESLEEWGGNVALLLEICIFAVIRRDAFTVFESLFGLVFGALGWFVAIWVYDHMANRNKKGKYLFNRVCSKGLGDPWRTMEFILGAIGGLGLMVGFFCNMSRIRSLTALLEQNGGVHSFFPNAGTIYTVLTVLCFVGILVIYILSEIFDNPYGHVYDLFERPLFNILPMAMLLLGSHTAAQAMTFFMLWYAAVLKCCFSRFKELKHPNVGRGILIAITAGVILAMIFRGPFSLRETWFLCGYPYLALEYVHTFSPRRRAMLKKKKAEGAAFPQLFRPSESYMVFIITLYHVIGFIIL